jgi:hypothetical protein
MEGNVTRKIKYKHNRKHVMGLTKSKSHENRTNMLKLLSAWSQMSLMIIDIVI